MSHFEHIGPFQKQNNLGYLGSRRQTRHLRQSSRCGCTLFAPLAHSAQLSRPHFSSRSGNANNQPRWTCHPIQCPGRPKTSVTQKNPHHSTSRLCSLLSSRSSKSKTQKLPQLRSHESLQLVPGVSQFLIIISKFVSLSSGGDMVGQASVELFAFEKLWPQSSEAKAAHHRRAPSSA